MPWIYPDAKIHEGTIIKVVDVDAESDTYYHVEAMIGSEYEAEYDGGVDEQRMLEH